MNRRIVRQSTRHGFSLLELAMVLAIIALLITSGLSLGTDALKSADRIATQNKLTTIKQALELYAKHNGYLPCPADRSLTPKDPGFGIEKRTTNTYSNPQTLPICGNGAPGYVQLPSATTNPATAFIGGLPVRTLGLSDDYAADAWGNKLTYAVSAPHTGDVTSYATQDGTLTVMYGDRTATNYALTTATDRTTPPTLAPGAAATYVVVSHGPDGRGAFPLNGTSVPTTNVCIPGTTTSSSPPCATNTTVSCNDIENCDDANTVFYDTAYNDGPNPVTYFDDYVVWGSNALQRVPVNATQYLGTCGTSSIPLYTGSTINYNNPCEPWCSSCAMNDPISGTNAVNQIPSILVPIPTGSQPNPPPTAKLCQKILTSPDLCQAHCYWAGPTSDATPKIVSCP